MDLIIGMYVNISVHTSLDCTIFPPLRRIKNKTKNMSRGAAC